VSRERLRESARRVNPEQVEARRQRRIQRRKYTSPGPNYMWHLDGNHKLRAYKLCIHGCIDGCTRLITMLRVNDNNRSDTVLSCFLDAVEEWGFPENVRSDKGGENVLVADVQMLASGVGSYLTGRSVHNQRIERLWVDVKMDFIEPYVNLFQQFVSAGACSLSDEDDLFVLHYMFLPMMNDDMQSFVDMWNNHPLSTMGYKSPMQLLKLSDYKRPQAPELSDEERAIFEDIFNSHVQDEYAQLQLEPLDWRFDENQRQQFRAGVHPFVQGDIKLDFDSYLLPRFLAALAAFRLIRDLL
jgi:hypothetical protein